jgi:hypothetical protein
MQWDRRTLLSIIACAAFVTCAAGCHSQNDAPNVDTIEIRSSGMFAYDMIVHANGQGEVEQFLLHTRRNFALENAEFQELTTAVKPYLAHARPASDRSVFKPGCANPPVDADVLYLRWQGPSVNAHRVIDFGCTHWWQSHRDLLNVIGQLERRAKIVQP